LEPLYDLPHPYDFVIEFTFFAVWFSSAALTSWWGLWWIYRRVTARQNRVQALNDATQLGEPAGQRLLVIRAVDDEASLVLAFGTIINYLTAMTIMYVLVLVFLFLLIGAVIAGAANLRWLPSRLSTFYDTVEPAAVVGFIVLTISLLGLLMLSRSVHGRELAVSPMECQINTQSTPDALGLSRIVTLVRSTYTKSLRHVIYDHEGCAKAISDWVHLQLCGMPVRSETRVVLGPERNSRMSDTGPPCPAT